MILSAEFELAAEDPESVVRRMRRIWIIKKENQPYGHQSSGCIFKNPSPDVSAGSPDRSGGTEGHPLRRSRGLRPPRQLHRRPSRRQSVGRAPAHRPDPPTRLAAIRLRVGTPDPDLVEADLTRHDDGGIQVMEHREPPRIAPGDRRFDGATRRARRAIPAAPLRLGAKPPPDRLRRGPGVLLSAAGRG